MRHLAAMCVTALSGSVFAQPLRQLPKVHQVRIRGVGAAVSPLVSQRLDDQLRKELGRSLDIALQPEFAVQAGTALGASKAALADRTPEARALAAKGVELLQKGDLPAAVSACNSAVEAFDGSIGTLANFNELLGALWLLATAQIRAGQVEEGDKVLQRLVTLDPDYAPKISAQGDAVAAVWKSVRTRLLRRKPGAIHVAAQPTSAMVTVDGRKTIRSPAKITGLLPGTHYVVVQAPGMRTEVERLDVNAGATSTASLVLEAAPAAREQAQDNSALAQGYYAEISKRLEEGIVDMRIKRVAKGFASAMATDYVVLADVERESKGYRLRAYLYQQASGFLAEMDATPFDSELLNLSVGVFKLSSQILAAIADFPKERDITTVVIKDGVIGTQPTGSKSTTLDAIEVTGERDVEKVDPTPPVYRRWWFWTALGVLAAGGAGAGIYLLATREPPSEASVDVAWQP